MNCFIDCHAHLSANEFENVSCTNVVLVLYIEVVLKNANVIVSDD
jgi:hypothetical protein